MAAVGLVDRNNEENPGFPAIPEIHLADGDLKQEDMYEGSDEEDLNYYYIPEFIEYRSIPETFLIDECLLQNSYEGSNEEEPEFPLVSDLPWNILTPMLKSSLSLGQANTSEVGNIMPRMIAETTEKMSRSSTIRQPNRSRNKYHGSTNTEVHPRVRQNFRCRTCCLVLNSKSRAQKHFKSESHAKRLYASFVAGL